MNYIIDPKTPPFSLTAAVAVLVSIGVTRWQQFPPLPPVWWLPDTAVLARTGGCAWGAKA